MDIIHGSMVGTASVTVSSPFWGRKDHRHANEVVGRWDAYPTELTSVSRHGLPARSNLRIVRKERDEALEALAEFTYVSV